MGRDVGHGEAGPEAGYHREGRLTHQEVEVEPPDTPKVDQLQVGLEPPVWAHHDQGTHDLGIQDPQSPVL